MKRTLKKFKTYAPVTIRSRMEKFFDIKDKAEFRGMEYYYEDGLVTVKDGEYEIMIPVTNIEYMLPEPLLKKVVKK